MEIVRIQETPTERGGQRAADRRLAGRGDTHDDNPESATMTGRSHPD
jgi:hypothetical protein